MTTATHAFITPSYQGDLLRFRLQCESMDKMAKGDWRHYVLVADHDYEHFKEFEGPLRRIIPDSVLLPNWLKPIHKPFDKKKSRIWVRTNLGFPLWPMSGWHVQQLRKMLIARHINEPNLVMVDSDTFFVKPFSLQHFQSDGKLRLYGKKGAIVDGKSELKHAIWVKNAARLLRIEAEQFPATDYITQLTTWRRDCALAMLEHIEKTNGCDVVTAMGRHRTFSEYHIYGSFVERVLMASDMPRHELELSQSHWGIGDFIHQSSEGFINGIQDYQVAISVQSFTETSIDLLRETYLGMANKLR